MQTRSLERYLEDQKKRDKNVARLDESPKKYKPAKKYKKDLEKLQRRHDNFSANAVKEAEQIFDNMFEACIWQDAKNCEKGEEQKSEWPDASVYNILMDIHARSHSKQGIEKALNILHRMEEGNPESHIASPNAESYAMLIKAYAERNQPEEAQAVLKRMEAMSKNKDSSSSLVPNTLVYNEVLSAWMKSNRPDAPEQAERLLRVMIDAINNVMRQKEEEDDFDEMYTAEDVEQMGDINDDLDSLLDVSDVSDEELEAALGEDGKLLDDDNDDDDDIMKEIQSHPLMPDAKSFVRVLRTFRQRSGPDDLDKVHELVHAQEVLARVTASVDLMPTTLTYNELVATLGETAANATTTSEDHAAQAEAMLYEMIEQSREDRPEIKPNLVTFRHVIFAYRHWKQARIVAHKVEKLLEIQEGFLGRTDERNYHAAFAVISKSNDPNKVPVIWRLLQQMNRHGLEPTSLSYDAVLDACAHPMKPKDPREAMSIAIAVMKRIETKSQLTYAHFLKTCRELLPEGPKREELVSNVFSNCCKEGWVGRKVMAEFLQVASSETIVEALGGHPKEGSIKIPRTWSRSIENPFQLLGGKKEKETKAQP